MSGERTRRWREHVKRSLVEQFGGKCARCGYSKCTNALDFHHTDPKTKKFTISSALTSPRSWNVIAEEAEKCILLCCLCHRELHYDVWKLSDLSTLPVVTLERTVHKKDIVTGACPVCGTVTYLGSTYCSYACTARRKWRVDWSKLDLLELTKTVPVCRLAKELNVSDSAIHKHLKLHRKKQSPYLDFQI